MYGYAQLKGKASHVKLIVCLTYVFIFGFEKKKVGLIISKYWVEIKRFWTFSNNLNKSFKKNGNQILLLLQYLTFLSRLNGSWKILSFFNCYEIKILQVSSEFLSSLTWVSVYLKLAKTSSLKKDNLNVFLVASYSFNLNFLNKRFFLKELEVSWLTNTNGFKWLGFCRGLLWNLWSGLFQSRKGNVFFSSALFQKYLLLMSLI